MDILKLPNFVIRRLSIAHLLWSQEHPIRELQNISSLLFHDVYRYCKQKPITSIPGWTRLFALFNSLRMAYDACSASACLKELQTRLNEVNKQSSLYAVQMSRAPEKMEIRPFWTIA